MDLPVYAPATCWAAEPVVGSETSYRPGRLIELHLIDLPVRHASPAEQEGQADRSADREQLARPNVEVAGLPAGVRRMGGVALDGRHATQPRAGKAAMTKTLISGI
jgi:hypothetical protein